jgi:hypothetical protein
MDTRVKPAYDAATGRAVTAYGVHSGRNCVATTSS